LNVSELTLNLIVFDNFLMFLKPKFGSNITPKYYTSSGNEMICPSVKIFVQFSIL